MVIAKVELETSLCFLTIMKETKVGLQFYFYNYYQGDIDGRGNAHCNARAR